MRPITFPQANTITDQGTPYFEGILDEADGKTARIYCMEVNPLSVTQIFYHRKLWIRHIPDEDTLDIFAVKDYFGESEDLVPMAWESDHKVEIKLSIWQRIKSLLTGKVEAELVAGYDIRDDRTRYVKQKGHG